MKKLLILTSLIFILASCDVPQRAEKISEYTSQGSNQVVVDGNVGSNQPVSQTTPASDNPALVPGYEYCTNTTPYNGQSIGMFGLCRHSADERKFRVKFVNGSTSGTCFVPTHRLNNGSSFKIGIAECVHNQAGKSYYMTLNKETVAPAYVNTRPEPINSVMVLDASAVNAYMACMNAKESYFLAARQVPGNFQSPPCCYQAANSPTGARCIQSNPSCEQSANNHASNVCSQFVQNYSNKYKQVIF